MPSFLDKIKRKLSNMGNSKSAAAPKEKSAAKQKRPPSPMPSKERGSDNPVTSEPEQNYTIQPHPAASTFQFAVLTPLNLPRDFNGRKRTTLLTCNSQVKVW